LEKVYPIGSYYWSSSNTSPSEIFGGSWTKIRGRFLFASDSNHDVGDTGGEEKHILTINEVPSHQHVYYKYCRESHTIYHLKQDNSSSHIMMIQDNYFIGTDFTDNVGGGGSHNNMPPYLTANCWKRIG
jgi:microcystin-dependent protein